MKLIEYQDKFIRRGQRIKFPSPHRMDNYTELLVVLAPKKQNEGPWLFVLTGGEAGNLECILPKDSMCDENVRALCAKWLIDNWSWVDEDSKVEEVEILEALNFDISY